MTEQLKSWAAFFHIEKRHGIWAAIVCVGIPGLFFFMSSQFNSYVQPVLADTHRVTESQIKLIEKLSNKLDNDTENHVSMVREMGEVRVYQERSLGNLQEIGNDVKEIKKAVKPGG